MSGSFEALRKLTAARFGHRVYLISKCGPKAQIKTLRWLKHMRYLLQISPDEPVRLPASIRIVHSWSEIASLLLQ